MKNLYKVVAVMLLVLLAGCNPIQFPVTLVQSGPAGSQGPANFQPQQAQPQGPGQGQIQTPQGTQVAPVGYVQQQVLPRQALSEEQLQQLAVSMGATAQVPVQPTPVRIQNASYVGNDIHPKYAGKAAGCQLFQMDLDYGPVTVAKCPSFNGPIFVQVNPKTIEPSNMERPGGGVLMFNDNDKNKTHRNASRDSDSLEDQ